MRVFIRLKITLRLLAGFIFVSACSLYLTGCSSLPQPKKPKPLSLPAINNQGDPRSDLAKPLPWEIWQPFQDLNGAPITNRQILLGDELLARGQRKEALAAFLSASSESLTPAEGEAATIRIASQYLALDQSRDALSATGAFFKRRGSGEAEVSVPFAIILGFAYGRHGDIDQSLAWFSKVSVQGRPGGPAVGVAESGTDFLLRTLSDLEFERVAGKWRDDPFVNQQVGRERLRRASPGYNPDDYRSDKPFWVWFNTSVSPAAPVAGSEGLKGQPVIGLLASMSGRFAALGRDTKKGFDLAVEANNQIDPRVGVELRDVGADSAEAAAAVRDLVNNSHVAVIAGPLLTESAVSAGETARELGVPLVSFSKSDSFQTGGGVFRLGATSSSQMEALVNSAFGDYGISRFAVIYPQTAGGTELLEAFRNKISALGLTLELELAYLSSDDASLIETVKQLEGSSVEGVLIADNLEVSEKILRSFSPGLNKRIRPLGSAMWDNAQKIARSQALFERALFVTPFFAQSTREEVVKFRDSYRLKYGANPNFLAAQGFDAGTLIVNALRSGLRGSGNFESNLQRTAPYRGVTGSITVSSSGEFSRSFYVVEVLRDSFQERMPPSNPTRSANGGSLGVNSGAHANNPLLDAAEKVDSGY